MPVTAAFNSLNASLKPFEPVVKALFAVFSASGVWLGGDDVVNDGKASTAALGFGLSTVRCGGVPVLGRSNVADDVECDACVERSGVEGGCLRRRKSARQFGMLHK